MLGNLIKYAFSEGIAKLAPFFTTLYIAKYLSVEEFGKYSLIFVVYELFFILVSFNIQATTRVDFYKLTRLRFLTTKREHLIISCLLALLVLTISAVVAFEHIYELSLLIFSSLVRCISVFQLAVYQCEKKASRYVASNLIFTLSLSCFTLMFVTFNYGYLSWLYGLVLAGLVQLFVSCILFGRINTLLYLSFNRYNFNFSSFKSTFLIALFFIPQALGWWLKLGADRWIIERKVGVVVLGQYSLAFQFSSVLLIAATVMNLVLVPEVNFSLKNANFKRVKFLLAIATIFLTILSIVIYISSREIIFRVYDEKYFASIFYLGLLVLPFLVQSLILIYSNILYFFSKGAYLAKIILITFLLQVIINYFFVDFFGVVGMALVSLGANVIVFAFIASKSRSELTVR
ncbi:oligosaccharide flippase family protein [Shewanella algae]|uniref:oligosaccharide flippase family protein n=1 Tax=Shewanella algae TaxID=38313 RepID=UPI001684B114|nr:oligosaccharide flippase family protein [Shewanella algae]MBO2577394.1 oligosaccharide flippase family protein [Shewanella algae]MBO2682959.1 oligosaccharide flippase family protein [Shewanella algae]MBO2695760.1 oligosaccharide flippase family protein [Shewanella algae]QNV04951.1 hypothetical protein EIY89_07285 [Shewanella algae]QQO83088.1 hypothetical protein D7032_07360 [Shewanella algae]